MLALGENFGPIKFVLIVSLTPTIVSYLDGE